MCDKTHISTARSLVLATLLLASTEFGRDQLFAQSDPGDFMGLEACVGCHERAGILYRRRGVESFVSMTEAAAWTMVDRHAQACDHIDPNLSDLARQIYKNLKIAPEKWESQRQCLSCHANWLPQQEALPPTYKLGVTCESCHGASKKWDIPHRTLEWRKTKVSEKTELGMTPVRHPVSRAEQCFSCHIGNASEQKVVTHAMYAAGHPPLPNVEIESFARNMPRHWRYLPEKGAFEHRAEFIKEHYGSARAEQDLPRTKAVVVGGAVALRFYLELLASQQSESSPTHTQWPELAAYDCSGCHHELKTPSWRQLRVDYGTGRPHLLEWPTLLAERVSLAVLNDEAASDDFSKHMQKLRKSLADRPFGTSPAAEDGGVSKVAQDFADWLKPVEQKLAAMRYDKNTAQQVVSLLTATASTDLWDFYTARQIADAYRTVQLELKTPYPKLEEVGATPMEIGAGHLKQFNAWKCVELKEKSEQLDKQFNELNAPLSLAELMEFGCDEEATTESVWTKEKIQRVRRELLESAAKYDARWFRERFGQIDTKPVSN